MNAYFAHIEGCKSCVRFAVYCGNDCGICRAFQIRNSYTAIIHCSIAAQMKLSYLEVA